MPLTNSANGSTRERRDGRAIPRRLVVAFYHLHKRLEPFSYEGHRYWRPLDVPDVALTKLPLSTRVRNVLQKAGILDAIHLAKRFQDGELEIRGVGPKAVEKVEAWLKTVRTEV